MHYSLFWLSWQRMRTSSFKRILGPVLFDNIGGTRATGASCCGRCRCRSHRRAWGIWDRGREIRECARGMRYRGCRRYMWRASTLVRPPPLSSSPVVNGAGRLCSVAVRGGVPVERHTPKTLSDPSFLCGEQCPHSTSKAWEEWRVLEITGKDHKWVYDCLFLIASVLCGAPTLLPIRSTL